MSSNKLCSYCAVHEGMVYCRHYDSINPNSNQEEHGLICYACLMETATGGMCPRCYVNFKRVHSPNHVLDLHDPNWQDYVVHKRQRGMGNWKVVDCEGKNK